MKAHVYYFEQKGEFGDEWVVDVTRPGSDGEVLGRHIFPHTNLMLEQFLTPELAALHAVDYYPEYATIAPEEIDVRVLFTN
jgi:hypothetical protein